MESKKRMAADPDPSSLQFHPSDRHEQVYLNSNLAFSSNDLTRIIIQSLHNLGYRYVDPTFRSLI
jgi:hypothetical protein